MNSTHQLPDLQDRIEQLASKISADKTLGAFLPKEALQDFLTDGLSQLLNSSLQLQRKIYLDQSPEDRANGYAPEMCRLALRFDALGIAFYGVHSRPGGADAPHPPIATSKASHTRAGRGMNQSTPRRLAERCIENSAVVHTNVCSRRSRERRSDRIHSETQRQAAWHFGCTLRARCRQSSEGTARVERTGRAAGGEWHRIIGELEGAIGSRRCAESGKLDTGSSA